MIMKKKFVFTLIFSTLLCLLVGVMNYISPNLYRGYASTTNYVLNLSSSNGNVTASEYDDNYSTTSLTKLGNTVKISYDNASVLKDSNLKGVGQLQKGTSSYYRNSSPILGIYRIDISYRYSGSDSAGKLHLGSLSDNNFTSSESYTITATSSQTTQTFENFNANYSYFQISNGSDRALYIYSIDVYYSCTSSGVNVTGVEVTPSTLSLDKGDEYPLNHSISPSDATNKNVTWSSEDTSIATVNDQGVVTAISKGVTNITCTTQDGGFTDTCVVTVNETETPVTPPADESAYTLVTDASQLVDGANIVMVSRSKSVIAGNLSSQYLSSVNFADLKADTTSFTSVPEGAIEFTLESSSNSWKFKNGDSYLGATAEKKLSFGSGTDTWNISISSNLATVQSTTSSFGRFLYNVSSPRFTTYTSSTSNTMLLIELFIKASGSSTEEPPVTPEEPEPTPTLESISLSTTKDTYEFGDKFDTSSLSIKGTYSNGSEQTFTFDEIDSYYCLNDDGEFDLNNNFDVAGEYLLTVTVDGIESDTLSFFVNEEEIEEPTTPVSGTATITMGSAQKNLTSELTDVSSYISTNGIEVSSAPSSKVFGLEGKAGFKLGSSKAVGSITFNFKNSVVITDIQIKMERYNSNTSTLKVSTSSNTSGETITLSEDYVSTMYDCTSFAGDTKSSTSLTISGASGRFHLYEIKLTIGEAKPVSVTGFNISEETITVNKNSTYSLNYSIIPSDATNKNVTWTSSNTSVATVSTSGVVSGISKGEATITGKTNDGNFTDSVTVTVKEVDTTYNNYYKATNVDPDLSLQELQKSSDADSIPTSSGTKNILVVPVEINGYSFNNSILSDLEIAFNGQGDSKLYWESVKSFYDKSSFGKMDLNFVIADVYESNKSISELAKAESSYNEKTQYISELVVKDYKTKNGSTSTQQFDSDSDGYIDALWMIYSCPNSTYDRDFYWAYVYWNNWNISPDTSSPVAGAYGWASYDFMYEKGSNKVDAHTYIHETGHLFGLDDYYNYDDDSDRTSLGGVDMMDYNVIDHNSWSKMSLGWVKPYVVTGNAEITINPAVSSGDCILIPDRTSGWNGTSYDEFILLELYSPTGLNYKDATTSYNSAMVYDTYGIRMYHVDSRLAKIQYINDGWYYTGYAEPSQVNSQTNSNTYFQMAHSNTPSYSYNENYQLIHLINADNTNSFANGYAANNDDLFQSGDTFSMSAYSKFFANGTKFNNGNALGYNISFINVSAASATIRITVA